MLVSIVHVHYHGLNCISKGPDIFSSLCLLLERLWKIFIFEIFFGVCLLNVRPSTNQEFTGLEALFMSRKPFPGKPSKRSPDKVIYFAPIFAILLNGSFFLVNLHIMFYHSTIVLSKLLSLMSRSIKKK